MRRKEEREKIIANETFSINIASAVNSLRNSKDESLQAIGNKLFALFYPIGADPREAPRTKYAGENMVKEMFNHVREELNAYLTKNGKETVTYLSQFNKIIADINADPLAEPGAIKVLAKIAKIAVDTGEARENIHPQSKPRDTSATRFLRQIQETTSNVFPKR